MPAGQSFDEVARDVQKILYASCLQSFDLFLRITGDYDRNVDSGTDLLSKRQVLGITTPRNCTSFPVLGWYC